MPALPSALPGHWVVRPPAVGDAKSLHALRRAGDIAVLGYSDVSIVDVEADLTNPAAPADRNQLVVADGSRMVAWLWLDEKSADEVVTDLYVDRGLDATPRETLAGWGWEWLLDRAAASGSRQGRDAIAVVTGMVDGDHDAERWLAAAGFGRVRTFWRMSREIGDTVEPLAPGVTVREVRTDSTGAGSDLQAAYEIHEEAFADHWNFHPQPFDAWLSRMQALPGHDPSLWWLAEVDDEPAGLLIGTTQMADEGALYVDTLGTARAARRRGVAASMLRASFTEAAERAMHRVCLTVDSENPTGALGVYERAGMRTEFAMHQWRRHVDTAHVPVTDQRES